MACNCKGTKTGNTATLLAGASPTSEGPFVLTYPDGTTAEFATYTDAQRHRSQYGGRITTA